MMRLDHPRWGLAVNKESPRGLLSRFLKIITTTVTNRQKRIRTGSDSPDTFSYLDELAKYAEAKISSEKYPNVKKIIMDMIRVFKEEVAKNPANFTFVSVARRIRVELEKINFSNDPY